MQGLTDEQAADAVRGHLAWKYALALPLHHSGFDSSVLSEFRSRLIAGGLEVRLLDTLLEVAPDKGLLKARGRARTDFHPCAGRGAVLVGRWLTVLKLMRAALNELRRGRAHWLAPAIDARLAGSAIATEPAEYQPPESQEARAEHGRYLLAPMVAACWQRWPMLKEHHCAARSNSRRSRFLRAIWVQQFMRQAQMADGGGSRRTNHRPAC